RHGAEPHDKLGALARHRLGDPIAKGGGRDCARRLDLVGHAGRRLLAGADRFDGGRREASAPAAHGGSPGTRGVPSYCRTACFSALPAENFGTRAAGIWTRSEGLRGLTPVRAARFCVENLPKPVNETSSPLRSVSVMVSRNASTALPASRFDSCVFRATSAPKSCLVTFLLLLWSVRGPRPLTSRHESC